MSDKPEWVIVSYDKPAEISVADHQAFIRALAYHTKTYEQRYTRIDQGSCSLIEFVSHADPRNPKNDRVVVSIGEYDQKCTERPSYKARINSDAFKDRKIIKRLCFYRIPRCDREYLAETKKLEQEVKNIDRQLETLRDEPAKGGHKEMLGNERAKLIKKLRERVAVFMKMSCQGDKGEDLSQASLDAMLMVLALYAGYASKQNAFSFRTDKTKREFEYNKATDTCVQRDVDVALEKAIALIEFERSTAAQLVKLDRYTIGVVEMAQQLGLDHYENDAITVQNITAPKPAKPLRLEVRKAYEILYEKDQPNGLRPFNRSEQTRCLVQAVADSPEDPGELLCVVGGPNDGAMVQVLHGWAEPLSADQKNTLIRFLKQRDALRK